jgi:tetratricopeptide (TPR) repeat protein
MNTKACATCNQSDAAYQCKCRCTRYCSKACQADDWVRHSGEGCTTELYEELDTAGGLHGLDSIHVAAVHLSLGRVLRRRAMYQKAVKHLVRASAIYRALGISPQLSDARAVEQCLGETYRDMGHYDWSCNVLYGSSRLDTHDDNGGVFPVDDAVRADALALQAHTYLATGMIHYALDVCMESLVLKRKVFGASHVEVGRVLYLAGTMNQLLGKDERGRRMKQHACLMEGDKCVGSCERETLALEFARTGAEMGDRVQLQQALLFLRTVHGDASPKLGEIMCALGVMYEQDGRAQEAMELCTEALRIQIKCLGVHHTAVAASQFCIFQLHRRQGNTTEAIRWSKQVIHTSNCAVGPMHISGAAYRLDLLEILVTEFTSGMLLYPTLAGSDTTAKMRMADILNHDSELDDIFEHHRITDGAIFNYLLKTRQRIAMLRERWFA